MDEELMNLAAEMAGDIDPDHGRANTPEPIEEVDNEQAESDEEIGNEDEASDEQDEIEEDNEDSSDEESEEESEEDSDEDETDNDEDKSIDESSDADNEDVHKITVDGEELEVSLKDLKENYSGQQAWDKKFTELNTDKQTHQAEVTKFNDNANQFQTLAKEGKAQEALDFIIELAGLNGNQFKEAYVKQLAPTIAEYLELSPEEREQRALKQQNEHYKSQHEATQAQQTQQAAATQQRTEVESVLTKHDMKLERFEELQKELIEHGIENLTADSVGQYHVMIVQQDMAVEVLKSINPELVKDKSAVDYLLSLQTNNPGIKKEELQAKAEGAFKNALAERVKKDSKATKPRKKGASKKANKKTLEDIITFDDLENINVLDLI